MHIASQPEGKKTRKYRTVKRALQAKILAESKELSQRGLAQKFEIPQGTIQYWADRKKDLTKKMDPNVVCFFESPSGQAWLHKLTLATFLFFHHNGTIGVPTLHDLFDLDFVHFLNSSSERSFLQLDKFLGRGRNTPSCEIYYAGVCFSLESSSKKCTKSS